MKNLNESFDAELIKRLRNYSEEPRLQLWQNIITTTEAKRRPLSFRKRMRTGWILILGMITVGGLYYIEKGNVNAASSLAKLGQPSAAIQEKDHTADNSPTLTPAQTQTITNEFNDNANPSKEEIANNPLSSLKREIGSSANTKKGAQPTTNMQKDERDNVVTDGDVGLADNEYTSPVIETVAVELPSTEKSIATTTKKKIEKDEGKTVIKEKNKKRNNFGLYFTIMPTFGYQRINSNSTDDLLIKSVERVAAFSTDRLGVRAELGVEDPITKRIKVFGGLVYYQRKQTIDYLEGQVIRTDVLQGPNGEVIVVPVYEYVERSFEYELKNLGVQLGVSYELSRKKLLHTLGTGFEFHIALNKLEDKYKAEFTNNPSAYVFYNLYYRLQYPAEGRLKAVFQPTLNYSFYINQNLNAPFYVKPYGLGLNLGFTYNFY